ncbi:MAG: carboxynorspermidine decarboxylase [Clostridiales bacterium]|nr:carboxynorspermidine decarboxylase [Clostridiales bacterium]
MKRSSAANCHIKNFDSLKTPCYVIDESAVERNCRILAGVMERTGCRILLAQKAFSAYSIYPLIGKYLSGTTASGLYEARLSKEEMGKENHIFSPAYKDEEFDEIATLCDHIVFNSLSQFYRYRDRCLGFGRSAGLRVNPEFSTQDHAVYDPCMPGSRLGVTAEDLVGADLDGIEGLHFHTLCEQDSDALEATLEVVEEKFSGLLRRVKWINFGGGHHITREGYDIERLERCILHMRDAYGAEIYLEPGEAVALNAGYLVTEVLDLVKNSGVENAVLDASAACHMPDVLEMPYRPPLRDSAQPGIKPYTYRLAGNTCLAGDIIGDYSFDEPLSVGNRLVFEDMAIYSMVKNNTFNGVPLPFIYILEKSGNCRLIKSFGYGDFKGRL